MHLLGMRMLAAALGVAMLFVAVDQAPAQSVDPKAAEKPVGDGKDPPKKVDELPAAERPDLEDR